MSWIKNHKLVIIIIALVILAVSLPFVFLVYQKYKPYYTAGDFGITTVVSEVDANQNGINEYQDILL